MRKRGDDAIEGNGAALEVRQRVAMNVTELRVARRLTPEELARRSGLTERELQHVEAAIGDMRIDTLSSLASGLDVDVTFLFRIPKDDPH